MRRLLPALLLAAACGGPPPSAVPSVALTGATDSLSIPDLDISDAVPLGPDRWAILSQFGNVVRVVDWTHHTVRPLGRPGVDYVHPSSLTAVAGTLYVSDWGKRALTAWTADGKLALTIAEPEALGGSLPTARDADGWLYAESRGGQLDSGNVVRWRVGAAHPDTVARLAPYTLQEVNGPQGRRLARQIYSGNDIWGVFPSGALWVARVTKNRLDQRDTTGAWRKGPALPDPIYPVTRFDKDYYIQGFPEDQRPMASTLPFAPVKAPFDAAFVEDDSLVWLQSSRSLTDSIRTYKVLDRAGAYAQEVRLKNARRILGAHGGTLLVAEQLEPGKGFKLLRYPSHGIP
ncbi:MAG TPA: hypothetical protein VLC11_02355 [Gemmatimonadales bacterium]|nr:hypothetical protein [Gemmatimonadales bacterium]